MDQFFGFLFTLQISLFIWFYLILISNYRTVSFTLSLEVEGFHLYACEGEGSLEVEGFLLSVCTCEGIEWCIKHADHYVSK